MSKEKKIFQLEKKEICITSSQIKQAIDLLVNENEILQEEIKRLKEEYMILQNASDKVEEELQKRIDKAIEYIENKNKYLDRENYYQVFEYRDIYLIPLLDILKGCDKE